MVSKENCGLADVELPSRSVKESTSKPSGKRRQQKQAKSSSKVYAERHRWADNYHFHSVLPIFNNMSTQYCYSWWCL